MIIIRPPESIFKITGEIQGGTFFGRWHFSFSTYYDPEYTHFGTLRVFNDDTVSPGGVWPLHPHQEIEVVTYCAGGEFRHADENGEGGVLKKGWVQHTTVGRGMWHSEINNRKDEPTRFIQMWFIPREKGLEPSVQQKAVETGDRTNRLCPLVSFDNPRALPIYSDAQVFSCLLLAGSSIEHFIEPDRGRYLYVVEGGPVTVNGVPVPEFGAAKVFSERDISVRAEYGAELLLVDVKL